MSWLLDTNAVIAIITGRPPRVRERLRAALAAETSVLTSSIVLAELWYGVGRSVRQEENAERIRTFLSGTIEVLDFGRDDARLAGSIRATLAAAGTPIGPFDVLIAAQALRTGARLVTANVGEFARVPDLVWEDWSSS